MYSAVSIPSLGVLRICFLPVYIQMYPLDSELLIIPKRSYYIIHF
jgi:hypothetical protein